MCGEWFDIELGDILVIFKCVGCVGFVVKNVDVF